MKLLIVFLAIAPLHIMAMDLEERKARINERDLTVSDLANKRKTASEKTLSKLGFPVNVNLPIIEDENEALVRTKKEVVNRALSLLVVAAKAEGLEQDIVNSLITAYKLEKHLSPNEIKFINDLEANQHDKTQFIWRYESAWTLLWALGYVTELTPPLNICDVSAAVSFMANRTLEEFNKDSKLRTITEILNENDLIYRYHWGVVDARINGLITPSKIDSSVVMERHYALNWLIGYMEQEWDNVSTDT